VSPQTVKLTHLQYVYRYLHSTALSWCGMEWIMQSR